MIINYDSTTVACRYLNTPVEFNYLYDHLMTYGIIRIIKKYYTIN